MSNRQVISILVSYIATVFRQLLSVFSHQLSISRPLSSGRQPRFETQLRVTQVSVRLLTGLYSKRIYKYKQFYICSSNNRPFVRCMNHLTGRQPNEHTCKYREEILNSVLGI